MIKELQALYNLYARASVHCSIDELDIILDDFHTIESVFKEYEAAKAHIKAINKERVENSLKLKALEIIKKKGFTIFDLFYLKNFSYEEYRRITIKHIRWGEERLKRELKTKEEFEILKEVML